MAYNITVTFGQYSSTLSQKPTMATACDELAYLYEYYKPLHENTVAVVTQICDHCSQGKVKKCKAPRRHSNGYHGERCYQVCKVCKGRYETVVEA